MCAYPLAARFHTVLLWEETSDRCGCGSSLSQREITAPLFERCVCPCSCYQPGGGWSYPESANNGATASRASSRAGQIPGGACSLGELLRSQLHEIHRLGNVLHGVILDVEDPIPAHRSARRTPAAAPRPRSHPPRRPWTCPAPGQQTRGGYRGRGSAGGAGTERRGGGSAVKRVGGAGQRRPSLQHGLHPAVAMKRGGGKRDGNWNFLTRSFRLQVIFSGYGRGS